MQRARGKSFGRRSRGNHRGGGGRAASPPGQFADGIWHCDCTPRLPASHFQVKKDSPNKGRWFWTCQQTDKSCKFFLWEKDAKPREIAAVMNDSRTEPQRSGSGREPRDAVTSTMPPGKGLFARNTRARRESSESSEPPAVRSSSKRTVSEAHLDRTFDDDDLDDLDEDALAELTDTATTQTPHKAIKTGVYATPGTSSTRQSSRKLPWLKDFAPVSSFFPTPSGATTEPPSTPTTTPARIRSSPREAAAAEYEEEHLAATPSKPPTKPFAFSPSTPSPTLPSTPSAPPTLANPASPPPPARYRDALLSPGDSDAGLTQDVLALLARHRLPGDALASLRSVLSTHDMRARGVRQARDLLRASARAKDEEIAELRARIVGLEAEIDRDKGIIRRLRGGKAQGRGVVEGFS